MERVMGIEPTFAAWEAAVLPLNYTRKVVYTMKTPYRDGTTQVAFGPVGFIAQLVALAKSSKGRNEVNRVENHPSKIINK
jgi:hypothetical protein